VVRRVHAPVYRERVVRVRHAPVYRTRVVHSYGYAPVSYWGGPSVSVGFGSGGWW
jgi:hypothetical protein